MNRILQAVTLTFALLGILFGGPLLFSHTAADHAASPSLSDTEK